MIKSFMVGFSRTINLQNYNSARVEAQVVYDVNPDLGETLEDEPAKAQLELRKKLEETWKNQHTIHTGERP